MVNFSMPFMCVKSFNDPIHSQILARMNARPLVSWKGSYVEAFQELLQVKPNTPIRNNAKIRVLIRILICMYVCIMFKF